MKKGYGTMRNIRRRYHFKGRVKGVGFRYKATYAARTLGLTGWVRNEYDGSVSMEVQGKAEYIDSLISKLFADRVIDIQDLSVTEIALVPSLLEKTFREKY